MAPAGWGLGNRAVHVCCALLPTPSGVFSVVVVSCMHLSGEVSFGWSLFVGGLVLVTLRIVSGLDAR